MGDSSHYSVRPPSPVEYVPEHLSLPKEIRTSEITDLPA